jgi:hypothetical protein
VELVVHIHLRQMDQVVQTQFYHLSHLAVVAVVVAQELLELLVVQVAVVVVVHQVDLVTLLQLLLHRDLLVVLTQPTMLPVAVVVLLKLDSMVETLTKQVQVELVLPIHILVLL